jgi:hypothetical protein
MIRFNNGFLLVMGVTFAIVNMISPSLFKSFCFGSCFGLIFLNLREEKFKK